MSVNVIFLAYRQWSLDVYPTIVKHPKVNECVLCKTHEELMALRGRYYRLNVGGDSDLVK